MVQKNEIEQSIRKLLRVSVIVNGETLEISIGKYVNICVSIYVSLARASVNYETVVIFTRAQQFASFVIDGTI